MNTESHGHAAEPLRRAPTYPLHHAPDGAEETLCGLRTEGTPHTSGLLGVSCVRCADKLMDVEASEPSRRVA